MAGMVGVRFERAGRVHYYAAAEALTVGDRVAVETAEGVRQGWVVIAPDQVVLDELPERPTAVARRLAGPTAAAVDDQAAVRARATAEGSTLGASAAGRFGLAAALVGPPHTPLLPPELEARAGLVARLAASLGPRNHDYLERKLRLPALGQAVATARGPGRVVAVQVLWERVTVTLATGGEVVLHGPGLEPVPPEEEPSGAARRGRRRERDRPRQGEADATPL